MAGLAGFADVETSKLTLQGSQVRAEVREAIRSAGIVYALDGASTLTLELHDPRRLLLRSKLFAQRTTVEVDGSLFELAAISKGGSTLTCTFEDAAVADLRRRKGQRVAAAGSTTRSQFARRLVAEVPWIKFQGEPTEKLRRAVSRGSEEDPDENTWECLKRLAEDRGWRVFAFRGTVYFGSDRWLRGLRPELRLSEDTDGVDGLDFDFDTGDVAASATLKVRVGRWQLPPGSLVRLVSAGAASGQWLVEKVSRSLFSQVGTVELVRQQPTLPEPEPDPPPADYDESKVPGGATASGPATPSTTRATSAGWAWPMRGRITSRFGPRRSPGGIGSTNHQGLDIAAPAGTRVNAARAGRVTHAGRAGGYGNAVYLDHGGGVTSRYAHLSRITVRVGQQVGQGQQIGACGATGTATGPHLHFEIRQGGTARNPENYLP